MSLFLGHVGSTPLLHLTRTSEAENTLKTVNVIGSTSFNSAQTFAVLEFLETAYMTTVGTYTVKYPFSDSTLNAISDGSDWLAFGVSAYGTPATVQGVAVAEDPALGAGQAGQFKVVYNNVSPYNKYIGAVLVDSSVNYVPPTYPNSYCDVYKVTYKTASSGGITAGDGDIVLGNLSLLHSSYLSIGRTNTIDKYYGSFFGLDVMVLNSRKTNPSAKLTLLGDSIYSSVDGINLKVFGSGQKNMTNVSYTATAPHSTSGLSLPTSQYSTEGCAIISVHKYGAGGILTGLDVIKYLVNTSGYYLIPYFYF